MTTLRTWKLSDLSAFNFVLEIHENTSPAELMSTFKSEHSSLRVFHTANRTDQDRPA